MQKNILLLLVLSLAFVSCKTTEKEIDKLAIAKAYFKVLDTSEYSEMATWFGDSLTTIEGEYEQTYSQEEYLKFLQWDAVFDPEYKIVEIKEEQGKVIAKISKLDQRIAFLHEKPFTTRQTIQFKNNTISSVATEYLDFDQATWDKNRGALVAWVDENHPELKGFLNDQTESGGKKFVKAIELYTSESNRTNASTAPRQP